MQGQYLPRLPISRSRRTCMNPSKQPTVQSRPTPHPRDISSERTENRTRFCKKGVVYISKRVSISFQYTLPRSLRRQTCQIHGCYITNRQPTETSRVQQHTGRPNKQKNAAQCTRTAKRPRAALTDKATTHHQPNPAIFFSQLPLLTPRGVSPSGRPSHVRTGCSLYWSYVFRLESLLLLLGGSSSSS